LKKPDRQQKKLKPENTSPFQGVTFWPIKKKVLYSKQKKVSFM
jgi:hypothetical protein